MDVAPWFNKWDWIGWMGLGWIQIQMLDAKNKTQARSCLSNEFYYHW